MAIEAQEKEFGRRVFLQGAVAGGAVLAAGTTLVAAPALASKADEEMAKIFGKKKMGDGSKIKLETPTIAENGRVVPIKVDASGAGPVKTLYVFGEKNPIPLVGKFEIGASGVPYIETNMRLKGTSSIIVVAELKNGKLIKTSKKVKVTIGGCGG